MPVNVFSQLANISCDIVKCCHHRGCLWAVGLGFYLLGLAKLLLLPVGGPALWVLLLVSPSARASGGALQPVLPDLRAVGLGTLPGASGAAAVLLMPLTG